jgi:60 kDa SS-A/Ro ribonucleoprotein
LGSSGGTFYVKPKQLTREHVDNLLPLLAEDGDRVVRTIVEISLSGRAPRNDPAVFALAVAASLGNDAVRATALQVLPQVCRTGTHLLQFAEAVDGLRGWGRGLRRSIGDWYNAKSVDDLELQLVKYQQREGWSNRDLLRLAHPKPASDAHRALFRWATRRELSEDLPRLSAMERLKGANATEAATIIRDCRLPREAVPTELLREPQVWEALLADMPFTAMVRNLATMTRVGLLTPGSEAAATIVSRLGDGERLRKARVHPMALLMAQRTYAAGQGQRSSGTWLPAPEVVDALDQAFYAAFTNAEPTGKRYLLGVDVSGSMSCGFLPNSSITACDAAAAMAMVTMATEPSVVPMAFADAFRPLPLSRRMRLDDVVRHTQDQNFGSTDCALPMLFALKKRMPVDVFVVYTDNETWFGNVHPSQALREYRERMGIPARLIVVAMTATQFSIADPKDAGMLDVVGFDASVPTLMADFVRT